MALARAHAEAGLKPKPFDPVLRHTLDQLAIIDRHLAATDHLSGLAPGEIDVARTGGDIGKIEKELGIPPGTWNKPGATLSRIDIEDPRSLNLRVPNGREDGANPLWMPGGKLPGGGAEAVIDQIPKGSYNETILGGP